MIAMRRPEPSDREWVLEHAVPMVAQIARRHGLRHGLERVDVERLEHEYVERLTHRFVESLMREHGADRSCARLYGNLEAYLARVSAIGARYGTHRARTTSLDDERDRPFRDATTWDAYDAMLHDVDERAEANRQAAEQLHQEWVVRQAARDRRAARKAVGALIAGDGSAAARAVRGRLAGRSPAMIAAQEGVTENAINARLSRWMRGLTRADQARLAPLAIVAVNPRKARRR